MIKTIPLDLPVIFFLGSLIAWVSSNEIHKKDLHKLISIKLSAAYGLWFGLTVTYFYFVYPHWMYSYFLPVNFPLLILGWLMFMSALIVASLAGFMLTALFQKIKLKPYFVPAYGFCMSLLVLLFTWNRYFALGSYNEFLNNQTVPLMDVQAVSTAYTIVFPLQSIPYLIIILYLFFKYRKKESSETEYSVE